jgi:chorismate mutase
MSHSTWINAQDLLSERAALRTEVAKLRTENERLRDALVAEVLVEVRDSSEHALVEPCASSAGC